MTYVLLGFLAYLALGAALTQSVLRAPTQRMRFGDFALGALFMLVPFCRLARVYSIRRPVEATSHHSRF